MNLLGNDCQDDEKALIYATIQGVKGLDSKVIVLDSIQDDIFSKYTYIAATRARTLLYIVGSEDFWNRVEG